MKRFLTLILTALALASGVGDAARRSGGGFGGSRSGSSAPRSRAPTPRVTVPRVTVPRVTVPRVTRPQASLSPATTPRTPGAAQPSAALPSTFAVKTNPLNTAAAAQVTPAQLGQWNRVNLPAGVPRDALTYSAAPSTRYQHQLQPGRYYPYPQTYYRQQGVGADLLKYALVFTAVSSIAGAVTPDVVAPAPVTAPRPGPSFWTYAGVGLLAAAAAWMLMGRRR